MSYQRIWGGYKWQEVLEISTRGEFGDFINPAYVADAIRQLQDLNEQAEKERDAALARAERAEAALASCWPWRSFKEDFPRIYKPVLALFADGSVRFDRYKWNYPRDFAIWESSPDEDAENSPNPAIYWLYADEIRLPVLNKD